MAGNSNYFQYTYSNYVNDKHICQGIITQGCMKFKKKIKKMISFISKIFQKMCTVS